MTVMPSLRLSPQDAEDVASYLVTLKKQEPSAYPDAAFMDDPKLKDEGKNWIRHFGCAGCHEISGLEDEGRIGTELTFEGSKPIERLDFALLTEIAQRGGSEPIADPEDLARLPEGPAKQPMVRPQGLLRTQARRAEYLGQGQDQAGTRKTAHAQSAFDQGTSSVAHYFPDG